LASQSLTSRAKYLVINFDQNKKDGDAQQFVMETKKADGMGLSNRGQDIVQVMAEKTRPSFICVT